MDELQKELLNLKIDKSALYRSSEGKDLKGLKALDRQIAKVNKQIRDLIKKTKV